ncbi:hypothetical protein BLNAU_22670 [Blattamonas nauphoetae]|uniref:B30.2/SPRY domain-containing protein n=1 Tax=Blattamonas nauphoetae TaxID=2049346 RepID=A0ABQ9WSG3_9EUKA|nr:hypothetical protein BLNAU_22670 [Blattamonas nauphoetae]
MTIPDYYVSSLASKRLISSSPSSHPNSFSKSRLNASTPIPVPLVTLPPLLFTDPSHFIINETTLTRSEVGLNSGGFARLSTALLKTPITQGTVSVTVTLLSLPSINYFVRFDLLDSTAAVPKLGEVLGYNVKDSLSLTSSTGNLSHNTPSTGYSPQFEFCHSELREGDCVRMEVDMKSNPQIVQFFVNGESGRSFVTGLPRSVRLGFTVDGLGTSFRIDRIAHQTQPTPIAPAMRELKW